jgi:iron complex outermembrane receptor protein
VGNFGTNLENGVASWVRPHFSQQLTFVRELSSGFTADRNYRNLAFGAETVFTTAAGRSDVLLGLSDRPYGAAGFYGVPSSIPSFERDKAWFAAWSQAIDKQTSASFAYRRHTDEYIYTLQDPSAYENNHIGEDWQASLRRDDRLAANTRLYYGADALREHIDSNSLGIHTRDQAGFYLSLDARSLRRFSLTAGVREELYTAGRQVFSPSISGAYWLTSRLKLHASASHAFRLPDYTELYYTDPIHLNDPNLKPETSWSYEGGVQLTLQRGLTAEATVFQHRDRDVIDYARPSTALPTTPYTAGNIDSLNFTGAELSLRWQLPQRQKIELAYSELHGDSSAPAGLAYLYSFNYPVHSGVATWWSHTPFGFDSRFRVAALERYGQSPYPLVEWAVSREFHWSTHYVTPYVQLTNMTNTKYQEISGVAMPGRGFVAGLELHWRER